MSGGQTIRLVGPKQRKLAHQLIDIAPDGAVVNIRAATRTLDQNAKMHAMLSDIARAKPDGRNLTTDIWKCLFLSACGHQTRFEKSIDGEGFVSLGHKSSSLSKNEFSDLIECIYEYGARHNVRWSDENSKGVDR